MSAKLSWSDRVVIGVASSGFSRMNASRLVRKVLWSLVRAAFLVVAARSTDDWIAVGLYVLAATNLLWLFFIGLAQRGHEERLARFRQLPAGYQDVLTDKTHLFSKRVRS